MRKSLLVLALILVAEPTFASDVDLQLPDPSVAFVPACPDRNGLGPIAPIPVDHDLDERMVELGRALFHDARLSADGSISCASCHDVERGGDDGRVVSVGVDGRRGRRNAPSVLNRVFDSHLFWDGRARNLIEQVDGPLTHPDEMDSSWELVVARLRSDDAIASSFRSVFGREVDADGLRFAIAIFEMSLITPHSPFDRFLCGESEAISENAIEGFRLFQELGCAACHQGRNVGGNMFQRFGIFDELEESRGADLGRFAVTGKPSDRFVFKVPSLRNVAETGPYFHDGSAATLPEAIVEMARLQLGRTLTDREVARLVQFLETLSSRPISTPRSEGEPG